VSAVDLFADVPDVRPSQEAMAEGAVLLHGFAKPFEADLIADLRAIVERAPFRHMVTPGGHQMSVAMTNCGSVGWVTDRTGYRYDGVDPESGKIRGRRCRHRFARWPGRRRCKRVLTGSARKRA
jgi:Alkylated DNA repair protein